MNTKRKTTFTILLVALLVLCLSMFVACNNTDTTTEETTTVKATEGLLISNSDFKVSTATSGAYTTYPSAPKSWTGASMYSSGSYPKDVIAGTINLGEALYNANKSTWESIENTSLYDTLKAKYVDDKDAVNNILMVYMPKDTDDDDDDDKDANKPNYGATAYGYTSSSFTVAAGGYYKFSVDVLTYDIAGNPDKDKALDPTPGARIYLSSSDYVEFEAIDTKGAWTTYTAYIAGSNVADKTLTVLLGLGKASSTEYYNGLTTGYAFFANPTLTALEDVDGGKTAEAQFDDAKDGITNDTASTTKAVELVTPNANFDFGTTTIGTSATPSGWSMVTGNSSDSATAAPTSANRYNGLIDLSKFKSNYTSYAKTVYDSSSVAHNPASDAFLASIDSISTSIASQGFAADKTSVYGTNAYMLSSYYMTAQGIKCSTSIKIEKNKCYAISIDVFTLNVAGAGVSLELTGGKKDLKIQGISKYQFAGATEDPATMGSGTTGGWKTYTFYIQGNQYEDNTYNMTLWLGTEGTDKNTAYTYKQYTSSSSTTATTYTSKGTFANGWAFFDNYSINTISASEYGTEATTLGVSDTKDASDGTSFGLAYSLYSDNLFAADETYASGADKISADFTSYDANRKPNGFVTDFSDEDQNTLADTSSVKSGVVDTAVAENFGSEIGVSATVENPSTPYELAGGNTNILMMYSKTPAFYKYETTDFVVEPNSFYRISLWVYTADAQSTSGIYTYLMAKGDDGEYTSKASFTQINTQTTTTDDDGNKTTTSKWQQLTFIIKGAADVKNYCHLKFTFGTGTRWTSATLGSGEMYVANMNMAAMTYTEYSAVSTGTYVKSASFATSSTASFTNGGFNSLDLKNTTFGDDGLLSSSTTTGAPENWTLSDKTTDAVTGVVSLATNDSAIGYADKYSHSAQTSGLFGSALDSQFDSLYNGATSTSGYVGGPNLLALGNKDGDAAQYALNYTSASFSLSASTYYEISVWARALKDTTYSIYLTGENIGSTTGKDGASVDGAYFVTKGTAADGWQEYKFFVSVGLSAISVKLELALGVDSTRLNQANVTYDDDDNFVSYTYEGGAAETMRESSGLVLFDNVTMHSSTTEAYEAKATDTNVRNVSYLSDGFSPASTSASTLSSLSSASNWSGAVDGSASSAKTKAGVLFIADSYLDKQELADKSASDYVSILGKSIKASDITVPAEDSAVTADNLKKYMSVTTDYAEGADLAALKAAFAAKYSVDNTDEAIRKEIINRYQIAEATKQQKASWIKYSELSAHGGNSCLVINNTDENAYVYTSSTYSFAADTYYKLSVWVRTYGIDESMGAYVRLGIGAEDVEDVTFASVNSGDWTQYTFFVKVQDDAVSSVTMKLGLGEYSDDADSNTMVSGYAFFDDFQVEKVTATDYEGATAGDNVIKYLVPLQAVDADTDKEPDATTPTSGFNLDNLWWMIPTILLALATIAVVVVYFVRKIKLPKKTSTDVEDTPGSRNEGASVVAKKKEDYDKYKE